jgi:hypothetical protein
LIFIKTSAQEQAGALHHTKQTPMSTSLLLALALQPGAPGLSEPHFVAINNQAPVQCHQRLVVHARPEKVWEVLAGIDRWPAWLTTVSEAKLNGPLQAQTTFDWKTGGSRIHSTLHTVEPLRLLGWTGKAYGTYAVHNWTLTDLNGDTEVTVAESMSGILTHLFRRALNRMLAKDMAQSLTLLKAACER